MNPDASADWASAILDLHQRLCDHLQKAQPGIPPVRLPDPTDWLQTMARSAPPGPASDLAAPFGLERLPTHFERDALWESAAQRYCAAVSALHAAWLEIGSDAFNALRQALDDKSVPQNLRGTYDLWVSCGEQAFAQQGATERYADLVSDLINAQVSLLLASGIGSAPPPEDPAALKDQLAAAQAREARLRADLEALHRADAAHTAPHKKRASKKKVQSAQVAKKKQSAKNTETTSAPGKRKKTTRKKATPARGQHRSKP